MELAYIFYYGGWGLLLIGVALLAKKAYQFHQKQQKAIQETQLQEKRKMEFYSKPILEKLTMLQINDILVHWNANYQVIGKITLQEMTWNEYDEHIPTGRYFPIICLDQNRYLVSLPKAEGIDVVWFFMEKKPLSISLTPFFEGTESAPGPAMQFADSNQTAHIVFRLPQQNDQQWQMSDIGSFLFEGEGRSFLKGKGEVRHVLAQSTQNSKTYMLYFDIIEGNGTNTLLIGETIDPEMEIEYILR